MCITGHCPLAKYQCYDFITFELMNPKRREKIERTIDYLMELEGIE